MRDSLYLGESPYEEECAQVGSDGYGMRAKIEIAAYRDQLVREYKREFGAELPEGCELVRTSNSHDFGTYYSLEAKYDDSDEAAANAAFWLEGNGPANWDDTAKRYIREQNTRMGV